MEGLLVALNQELDGIAYRSQCRSRTEENRLIVSRSLLHMSELLGENARQLRAVQRIPQEAYTVKVGVSAKGRHGVSVSGDRGLCLHTEDGRLFVILCDGAGTGPEAARESLLAVDTLTALLQAGMVPDKAMEFLNSMYILRDSGGFSTMDVLELSLLSGQGTLYKWGAAPSYIRSGTLVKKVGTAAPPPGLGVGSTSGPEVIRLSLWGGDMLVLVSDGVLGDETEELIRSYDGENVKELSNMLISQAEAMGGEDDMTAAVLRLEEKRT
jgi:stage II sporulation protein E